MLRDHPCSIIGTLYSRLAIITLLGFDIKMMIEEIHQAVGSILPK
jgi:hypothetical protein